MGPCRSVQSMPDSNSSGTHAALAVKRVGLAVLLLLILWLLFFSSLRGRPEGEDNPASVAYRAVPESSPGTAAMIERLENAHLLNGVEVFDRLGIGTGEIETEGASRSAGKGFLTSSPYEPRYRETSLGRKMLRYPLPGMIGV